MTKSVFAYRNGVLCVEAIPLSEIAEDVDTPFYCTSAKQLQRNYRCLTTPFHGMDATFHYSVKANANLAIIRVLADCGAGAEVASVGELERALEAGVAPSKMMLSGLGSTHDDIAAALLAGVKQINAETISGLLQIEHVASVLGKIAPVSLRINPEIDVRGPDRREASCKDVKGGLDFDSLGEALRIVISSEHMVFKGLAVHVESADGSCEDYRACYQRLAMIVGILRGQGIAVDHVDLGGGLGLSREGHCGTPIATYASLVRDIVAPLGCALSFEPGRSLVGDASALVTRVLHVGDVNGKSAVVVDAGLNDLMTPALHNIRHEIIAVREGPDKTGAPVSIVGPVSESKDLFGDNYMMPPLQAGDLISIMQTGAYGSVMASGFSGRALVPEVLVSGAQYAVIRRRIAVAEQMGWETIPDWMVIHRAA